MTVEVTGKRKREVGLVVPAKFNALTKDKKTAKVLDKELFKKKARYKSCLELIHQQKNVYRMFPIYVYILFFYSLFKVDIQNYVIVISLVTIY